MDDLLDHLGELNDLTARIHIGPDQPVDPDIVFGLDTKLFLKSQDEGINWAEMGGKGKHEDEVETRKVWRGRRKGKRRLHQHDSGEACETCEDRSGDVAIEGEKGTKIIPFRRGVLESALAELSFEIYRGVLIRSTGKTS